jgi:hypothetical protein
LKKKKRTKPKELIKKKKKGPLLPPWERFNPKIPEKQNTKDTKNVVYINLYKAYKY